MCSLKFTFKKLGDVGDIGDFVFRLYKIKMNPSGFVILVFLLYVCEIFHNERKFLKLDLETSTKLR